MAQIFSWKKTRLVLAFLWLILASALADNIHLDDILSLSNGHLQSLRCIDLEATIVRHEIQMRNNLDLMIENRRKFVADLEEKGKETGDQSAQHIAQQMGVDIPGDIIAGYANSNSTRSVRLFFDRNQNRSLTVVKWDVDEKMRLANSLGINAESITGRLNRRASYLSEGNTVLCLAERGKVDQDNKIMVTLSPREEHSDPIRLFFGHNLESIAELGLLRKPQIQKLAMRFLHSERKEEEDQLVLSWHREAETEREKPEAIISLKPSMGYRIKERIHFLNGTIQTREPMATKFG